MASYQTRYPSFGFTSQEALRTQARPAASPGSANARAEGRAAAAREAQQVAQFLIQAGRPELVGQLAGLSLEQVRAALAGGGSPGPSASDPGAEFVRYLNSLSAEEIDATWQAALARAAQGVH